MRGWRKGGPLRAEGANILDLEKKKTLENWGLNFQGVFFLKGIP